MAVSTIPLPALNMITGSFSETVPASTVTTLGSISIPSGNWVLFSLMTLNKSGSSVYNHSLGNADVRSSETNGGGSVNIVRVNGPQTINVSTYHHISGGCTVSESYTAFRIN